MGDAVLKKKVCVVVASRANYGRIKSLLQAIKDHPDLELQLVVGASALLYRFGRAIDVIRRDGFDVNATVYIIVEGENPTTMAKSTGLAVMELATIFENLKPDVVVTVADRFETMSTAIAASYMNIPLAHTQGGELTGSIDESVRHAITKLAHCHFPATEESRQRLIKMGEQPERIFLSGCPSIDLVRTVDLDADLDVWGKYGGVGATFDLKDPFLLVLQHPVTTEYGSGFEQINETIKAVHAMDMPAIWLWPNVDAGSDDVSKGLRVFRENHPDNKVHFFRNFAAEDFYWIMNRCACVVGNSSSPLREGAFLGAPAVNVGSRQRDRERGENIMDAGYNADEIKAAIEAQVAHGRYPSTDIFGDGKAGENIAEVLAKETITINKRLTY